MPGPIPNREKRSALDQGGRLTAMNRMLAYGISLPDDELRILVFILRRTILCRNQIEEIPDGDFFHGVRRRAGLLSPATGLSREAISSAVMALIERGAIRREIIQGAKYYEPNLEWIMPGPLLHMPEIHEGNWDYSQLERRLT